MIKICKLIALTFFISGSGCASVKNNIQANDTIAATALQPFGRSIINSGKDLELISSAVHFGFSFEGSECQVYASVPDAGGHNYLQYVLDDIYQKRIKISGNNSQPITLTAPKNGRHTIWIYKATEATTGPIFIQKIAGKNLKVLSNSSAPLIEFIGNSITCGAAADASEIPCGSGDYHDHHNAYYAYGPRVARALGLNYIMSSVSGIGIYRTWNRDGPSMPQVYEKTNLQDDKDGLWNFSNYSPEIVSIALGTNDFSNGDGVHMRPPLDSAVFVSSYIKFVQLVKSKYSNTQIALLSSPMVSGTNGMLLEHYLQVIKQHIDSLYPSSKPVALFFFKPMQPHGCSGHPSVEDHAILADELMPFFKKLMQ